MGTDTNNTSLEPHHRDELRLLYQVSVSDIAFFKQQQWLATSYTLAIHASMLLIGYQLLSSPLEIYQRWVLVVLTWAATVGGLAVISRLQYSILGRRTRLDRVRETFGKPFNNAWSIAKAPDDNHWLLVIIVLVAAAVITWLILVRA